MEKESSYEIAIRQSYEQYVEPITANVYLNSPKIR